MNHPSIPVVLLAGLYPVIGPLPQFFFGSDADPTELIFAALTPQPRDPRYPDSIGIPRSLVIIEQLPTQPARSVFLHHHLTTFTLN